MGPSERDFLLARFVAYSTWQASHRTALWECEDVEQDAYVALIAEWPNLIRRFPNGVPEAIIVLTTRSRLLDVLRKRTHWRATVPETQTANIDSVVEPADDFDTEREAFGAELDSIAAEEMIERLVARCPAHRALVRYTLRRFAEGGTRTTVAAERGCDPSWITMILRPLRQISGS